MGQSQNWSALMRAQKRQAIGLTLLSLLYTVRDPSETSISNSGSEKTTPLNVICLVRLTLKTRILLYTKDSCQAIIG